MGCQCAVCGEPPLEYIALPCHHLLCTSCHDTVGPAANTPYSFKAFPESLNPSLPKIVCPKCSREWAIGVAGVTGWQKLCVPWIPSQADARRTRRNLLQSSSCTLCSLREQDLCFCTECKAPLCGACHAKYHLKLHPCHEGSGIVVPLDQCLSRPALLSKAPVCKTHFGKPAIGYCERCKIFVCGACMTSCLHPHDGHRPLGLGLLADMLRKPLVRALERTQKEEKATADVVERLEQLLVHLEQVVRANFLARSASSTHEALILYQKTKAKEITVQLRLQRMHLLDIANTAEVISWILDEGQTAPWELIVACPVVIQAHEQVMLESKVMASSNKFEHPLYIHLRLLEEEVVETGENCVSLVAYGPPSMPLPGEPIELRITAAQNYLGQMLPGSSVVGLLFTARWTLVGSRKIVREEKDVPCSADRVLRLAHPGEGSAQPLDLSLVLCLGSPDRVVSHPTEISVRPGTDANFPAIALTHCTAAPLVLEGVMAGHSPLVVDLRGRLIFLGPKGRCHREVLCPSPTATLEARCRVEGMSRNTLHMSVDSTTGVLITVDETQRIRTGEARLWLRPKGADRARKIELAIACVRRPGSKDYLVLDQAKRCLVLIGPTSHRSFELQQVPKCLAVTPDGRFAVVLFAQGGMPRIINLETGGNFALQLPELLTKPCYVGLDSKYQILVLDAASCQALVFAFHTGNLLLKLDLRPHVPHCAAISPLGDLYISTTTGTLLVFASAAWTSNCLTQFPWKEWFDVK